MNATDPRPVYAAAVDWVASLLDAVRPDQLGDRTPCAEFDVLALSGHLLGTAGRAVALGAGTDIFAVDVYERAHDPARYRAVTAHARQLWTDDARLDAAMPVPWGLAPGRVALWAYVSETLVHGWDLAVSTGQASEAPAGLADAAFVAAQGFLPAEIRADDEVPFDEVVPARPDAGATERLANWSGRTSVGWVGVAAS